ncbi:MAG: hypothetical protein ACYTXA_07130 [Nostoc sp.]
MRYNIILRGVGARQCRAPTGVNHVNEKRYKLRIVTLQLLTPNCTDAINRISALNS